MTTDNTDRTETNDYDEDDEELLNWMTPFGRFRDLPLELQQRICLHFMRLAEAIPANQTVGDVFKTDEEVALYLADPKGKA